MRIRGTRRVPGREPGPDAGVGNARHRRDDRARRGERPHTCPSKPKEGKEPVNASTAGENPDAAQPTADAADTDAAAVEAEPYFAHPEGLRWLLYRLAESGEHGWEHEDAERLIRYARDRYAELARKHHCEPHDAAVAAFEAMRNMSTRIAADPWGVTTAAVERTLIADERANDLLTSTEQARRAEVSRFHDVTRFGDHDYDLSDFHPALQTPSADSFLQQNPTRPVPGIDAEAGTDPDDSDASVDDTRAVTDTINLLTMVGWPEDIARMATSYVCAQLMDIAGREAAYERLRRDKTARAQFDLSHESWIGLLRVVLGHPNAQARSDRSGVLARMLSGETIADLLADDPVVQAVDSANPHTHRNGGVPRD